MDGRDLGYPDSGVTLIEVLLAFVILLLAMIPLTYLLDNQVGQASQSRNRITALSIAETAVETLANNTPPTNSYGEINTGLALAPTGGLPATQKVSGVTYTTTVEYDWAAWQNPNTANAPDICTTGTPQLLRMTAVVSWGAGLSMSDTVLINYPPAGIQTLGFIAFQINGDSAAKDAAGTVWSTRVKTIPVTFTETAMGSGQTLPLQTVNATPDVYGCVFVEVVPGTWTVTAGAPGGASPGYTTNAAPQGAVPQLANQTTAPSFAGNVVSIGQTSSLTTTWDQGTLLKLNYPTATSVEDGVTCPGTAAVTCISAGESAAGATLAWPSNTTNPTASTPWTQAPAPSSVSRIASIACTTTTTPAMSKCVGVGYGLTGGSAAGRIIAGTSPATMASNAPDTLPAGVAALTQVVCPPTSASAGVCVAIGSTTTGGAVVLTGSITSATDTWTAETLASVATTLTQVACPSATGCIAVGANGTSPVAFSGSPAAGSTWVLGTPPTGATLTTLTQVTCPSAAACLVTGTGTIGAASGPLVLSGIPSGSGFGSAVTYSVKAIPAADTLTSLTQIVCPSTSQCLVTGTGTVSGTASAAILSGSPSNAIAMINDAVPHSPTIPLTLSQLTCPSSTMCSAIGASATGPVSISATLGSPDAWSSNTVPSVAGNALTTLNSLTCPTASICLATGSVTTGTTTTASVVQGAVTSGATTTIAWVQQGLPTTENLQYLDGVACVARATSYCAAVGATTTSAVMLGSVVGSPATWSLDQTATGLSGLSTVGVPVELSFNLLYATESAAGGSSNPTTLGPIYPLASGYSLFAGDCQAELGTGNTTAVATTPGASPNVTVPLGLLSVLVTKASTGQPYSNATVTLKSTTSGAGCGTDTYSLQTTGPDGLSRTQVPYGTYTLVATNAAGLPSAGVAVAVGPNAVTAAGATSALPAAIGVTVS